MLPRLFVHRYYSTNPIKSLLSLKPFDKPINIRGWVKEVRRQKKFTFLKIEDGSCLERLQVVIATSECPKKLGYHSCVSLKGVLKPSLGQEQDLDFIPEDIEVLSDGAPIEYPFVERCSYKQDDLRLLPHFRPRTQDFASMLRLRSQAKMAVLRYFEDSGFINIDTPILTTNDCEGGCNAFAAKASAPILPHDELTEVGDGVFGHPVYLTVSGQLHLEAMCSAFSKVFTFNPTFRGEKGTRLHLHEFWMVEAEEVFQGDDQYSLLLQRMEDLVKSTLRYLLNNCEEDLEFQWKFHKKLQLKENISKLLDSPFVRLKFSEAIKILKENSSLLNTDNSPTQLNRKSELFLAQYFENIPVFITDWPLKSKPFYMLTAVDTSCGVDLLFPGVGEVAGGGLRETNVAAMRNRKDDPNLDWYFGMKEWGQPPTGGFGLGFERFLQFTLGVDNIKDVIPFFRGSGQCIC